MADQRTLTCLASGWKMARILVVAQQSILLLWPQLSYNFSHMGEVSAPQNHALSDAIKLVPAKPMDALSFAFRDGGGLGSSPDSCILRKARTISSCRFVNDGGGCLSGGVFLRGFACTLRQDPTPILSLTRRYSSFVMPLMVLPLRAEQCRCLGTCPVDSRAALRPYTASVACFQTAFPCTCAGWAHSL